MRTARLALTQLGVIVGLGFLVAAAIAVFLPHHAYFHELRTVGIFVGVVLLAFGAAGAGGMPMEFRVVTNSRRLPGLGAAAVTDEQQMRVSPTALLIAAGAILLAFGIAA